MQEPKVIDSSLARSVQVGRRFPSGQVILALLAGGWLSGCMVGPDFHRPRPDVPAGWIGAGPQPTTHTSSTNPATMDVVAWWTTFRDPTLDRLIRAAADSNLDLLSAESRVRQARANRGISASVLFPQVNATGSYRRSGTGGGGNQTVTNSNGAITTVARSTRQDLWQAGFDANWEIDIFGGLRRGVEASDAQIVSAIEDRRDIFVTTASEIAVDYLSLRGVQRQIAITENNLLSQRHTADLTRRKFNAGFVSRLDVANADAQVATTLAQLPTLEISAQQTIYALSILLGRQPGVLVEELATPGPVPATPPDVPIGLPSELVRRRPDIRRAEDNLHAATAEIGVATADLFPKFSLSGTFNQEASKFRALGNWSSSVWSFGPSIDWSIFSAGRVQSNIQVQTEVQRQALLAYQQTVLNALQEVEADLIAYEKEQERRFALIDAVKANQDALNLSTRLYQQGQTDFLNVLNAERSLFASQDALAQSDTTVATNLAALFKALGGGWQVTENPLAWPVASPTTAPVPHAPALPPGVFTTPAPATQATLPAALPGRNVQPLRSPDTEPDSAPGREQIPIPGATTRPDGGATGTRPAPTTLPTQP